MAKRGIHWGDLKRRAPLSDQFGFDRGTPVSRFLLEQFLAERSPDILGHVLEIGDDGYTRRFGGSRVTRSDVLHAVSGNPAATIVADLARGDSIPSDQFDCILLIQTLQCIFDVRAAIATVHRILKPGGAVLATVPGISRISRYDMDRWGEYWRFTTLSLKRLFEAFQATVRARGNVMTCAAALYGLAAEELEKEDLEFDDPNYELLITVRARK